MKGGLLCWFDHKERGNWRVVNETNKEHIFLIVQKKHNSFSSIPTKAKLARGFYLELELTQECIENS